MSVAESPQNYTVLHSCGQEGRLPSITSTLLPFTGEFGSVMEGNLQQEDGTSQKVAVKTMKCEFPAWDPCFQGGRLPPYPVPQVEQGLCSGLC